MIHASTIGIALAFAFVVPPPLATATANVNDTSSHGKVGDSKLSLEEAIQLLNGTLPYTKLSKPELNQISGSGVVETVRISAAATPIIKLEKPLSSVVGQGKMVKIEGVPSNGKKPILDANTQAVGFSFGTHLLMVKGLLIRAGKIGVQGTTKAGSMMMRAHFQGVDVEKQTTASFRFTASSSDTAAVYVSDSRIDNSPLGFHLDDKSVKGQLLVEGERLVFRNVTVGVHVDSNGSGLTSMARWWRCDFADGDTFLRLRRGTTTTQRQMLRIVHGSFVSKSDLTDIQGTGSGETVFHHHHALFKAPAGKRVFWTHPNTARFDLHGSEMIFDGDVTLHAGRLTGRVWSHNNEFRNSSIEIDNDGRSPDFRWNRYQNCTIKVVSGNATPVQFETCEFWGSSVDGLSKFGSVTLKNCYTSATKTTGSVTTTSPITAPWLGVTAVSDSNPGLGDTVIFGSYMPANMGLIWTGGVAEPRPTTTNFPFRFYMQIGTWQVLSSPLGSGLQLVSIKVPNIAALSGLELYAQALSYPTNGQAYVPGLNMPTGSRIVIK